MEGGAAQAPSTHAVPSWHVTVTDTPPLHARSVRPSTHALAQPPSTAGSVPPASGGATQSPCAQTRLPAHATSYACPSTQRRTVDAPAHPATHDGGSAPPSPPTNTHCASTHRSSDAHDRVNACPSMQ